MQTAVVVGFNRYGGVPLVIKLLQGHGYQRIGVAVNDSAQLPELREMRDVSIVRVANWHSSGDLLRGVQSFSHACGTSPFVCFTDRPMFSYLDAFRGLTNGQTGLKWVPCDGIRRARMKPRARHLWDEAGLRGPRWRVLSTDLKRNRLWRNRGGLVETEGARYIVKPIEGAGSEGVISAEGWCEVLAAAERIRSARKGSEPFCIYVDEELYVPAEDMLVEEEMSGPEYTVDGFVQKGVVTAVVQHKETKRRNPFFGDGLIISPPDPAQGVGDQWEGYESERHSGTPEREFIRLVEKAVQVLRLDDWAFHAEMMDTASGVQFVELNPRPAGGLLWQTAGLRLGVDPFAACVALHLGNRVAAQPGAWVTGQFPIYAERTGVITAVPGLEDIRNIRQVHDVQSALPPGGIEVKDLNREHYLAFVSIKAHSHSEVRAACREARQVLQSCAERGV